MAPKNQTRKLGRNMATMHGVNHWYKREFEKLGWMVLAKAKGYTDKVDSYKKSVDRLIYTIQNLKTEYENHNRKHDLNVLLAESKILQAFVKKHF
jgi:hypothetical protein